MLYTFNEFSTEAILKIGDSELLQQYTQSKPLELYTFIWAREQTIDLKVDDVPLQIKANNLLALTPNQHFQINSELPVIVYQFNREFYCIKDHDQEVSCVGLLFFGNQQNPIIRLDENEPHKFELLHNVFVDEITTEDTIQGEMLRMLMARFIIKTTRLLKSQTSLKKASETQNNLLRQFNFLVEQHFKTAHKVSFYADLLYKSPKTLSNSFAKYQLSPLQIIHERLVLETKRQLMYTDKTAKEIAFDLGFEDASHLSRLFKKQTGTSPSLFKQIHNNLSTS